MAKKPRLNELAADLASAPVEESAKPVARVVTRVEPNPDRGERSEFLKVTVTMPADMLEQVRVVGIRRRSSGQKDTDVSSLVREALADMLAKEHG